MTGEICELTELPVDQCGCRLHATPDHSKLRPSSKNAGRVCWPAPSFGEQFELVWDRIRRRAGENFETSTGLPFTYRVPGDYLRIERIRAGDW